MTFLSQKIRRILLGRDRARAERGAALVAAREARAPALRLVGAGEAAASDRDMQIRAAQSLRAASFSPPAAAAFIAGEGARLYSLDVFRNRRGGGSPGPAARRARPERPGCMPLTALKSSGSENFNTLL